MSPFNTLTVLAHGSIAFWLALFRIALPPFRSRELAEVAARKELTFHQVFYILKDFVQYASQHTVEQLQNFTSTRVPTPPWVKRIEAPVPTTCIEHAATLLREYLGPAGLEEVGGEKWWTLRGCDLAAEWVGIKAQWTMPSPELTEKMSAKGKDAEPWDADGTVDSGRVMLYIHGGAYYWGGVNTHRFMIWRYARKMRARAYAVVYRCAPQYPFPCPLHDSLAAYLYLIRPPKGARHAPVSPAKLIIAGDSAGGGLTLALLQIIRDMSLPMPAGAVLISPWVDLTHSFPSVMENTKLDYLPQYGFLHKPSALWPPPPRNEDMFSKGAVGGQTNGGSHGAGSWTNLRANGGRGKGGKLNDSEASSRIPLAPEDRLYEEEEEAKEAAPRAKPKKPSPIKTDVNAFFDPKGGLEPILGYETLSKSEQARARRANPLFSLVIDGKVVEANEQIQLYTTNELLLNPLVSPAFCGSLGGLCPLLFLAGRNEVLIDEITYTAHKAAHPQDYAPREPLMDRYPKQRQNLKKYPPTKVHLQIFDDMVHVFPLFSFTTPAKYGYRSIASFGKWATSCADGEHESNGNGNLSHVASPVSRDDEEEDEDDDEDDEEAEPPSRRGRANGKVSDVSGTPAPATRPTRSATTPFRRPAYIDHMIRERIDIEGKVSSMEPASEMPCLRIPKDNLARITERPIRRWLEGREIWGSKFGALADKIQVERTRHMERSKAGGRFEVNELLLRERPPPSSLAGRRDTKEAATLASALEGEHHSFGLGVSLFAGAMDLLTGGLGGGKEGRKGGEGGKVGVGKDGGARRRSSSGRGGPNANPYIEKSSSPYRQARELYATPEELQEKEGGKTKKKNSPAGRYRPSTGSDPTLPLHTDLSREAISADGLTDIPAGRKTWGQVHTGR